MKLIINGKEKILELDKKFISIRELLYQLNIEYKNIAIAVNESIIHKEQWDEPIIKEGDQIEIVQAVQGG